MTTSSFASPSTVTPSSTYSSPISNSIGLSPTTSRTGSSGTSGSSGSSSSTSIVLNKVSCPSNAVHVTTTSIIPIALTLVTIVPAVISIGPVSPAVKSTCRLPSSGTLNSTVSSSSSISTGPKDNPPSATFTSSDPVLLSVAFSISKSN